MTTPAIAIRNEIRELIHAHIERFGQLNPLPSAGFASSLSATLKLLQL